MFESGKRKAQQPQQALAVQRVQAQEIDAATLHQQAIQRAVYAQTTRPVNAQQQVIAPILRASQLSTAEDKRLTLQRAALQQQIVEVPPVPTGALEAALQRQAAQTAPLTPVLKPQSHADWVTVMRFQAEQAEGRRMGAKESAQFTALQRQIATTLTQGFRQDRQAAAERYAEYADHLVSLQRHPLSGHVAHAVLTMIPQWERPALQRAVDERLQRQAEQQAQDTAALTLQGLQRQAAELEQEASQSVFQRIQARRGAGNPLPEAIQRHLELGLNHDLSRVRIHDDAEADRLAKGVNAIAFTTGSDIFFQSGKFNPNTQSGLELLAHETTHVVQQSQGKVGQGIDPDAGLETEARTMGKTLSLPLKSVRATPQQWLTHTSGRVALQRLAGPTQAPLKTATDDIATPTAGINKIGFIKRAEGANLRTSPAELSGSKLVIPEPLPPGTRLYVNGTHPQKPEWYYVTANLNGKLLRGYVQNFRVVTELPEPAATLYFVKNKNETLRPLAQSIYHQDVKPGRDLRFYEQAVLYLSQNAGLGGAKWGMAMVNNKSEMSVLLQEQKFIWLPSPAFANTLAGQVPSGSITGGAVAKAQDSGKRLQDVLASIKQAPQFAGKVGSEYWIAIKQHWLQIAGVTSAFLAAEGLSVFLAATPTGIGQLAAGVIQAGLGAWATVGAGEAIQAAMPYAQTWLNTAWKANGDPKQIAIASENFLYMVVQMGLAAMALAGGKGNMGKGLKLLKGVDIKPPSLGTALAVTPNGQGLAIPILKPGSITATGTAAVKPGMGSLGPASSQVKPAEATPTGQSELEKALANKNLSDEQLEALLKKTKNWDELQKFIGMKADKSAAPPPGYEWFTVDGKTRIRRMKGNKASGDYAPLTVMDDGIVVLSVGGSNRLSVYSRYRKGFLDYAAEEAKASGKDGATTRAAAERLITQKAADGRPLYQLHHMIPDNVAQTHALVKAALEKVKGYTIDRGSNMFALPRNLRSGEPYIHNGSHPRYDAWVGSELDSALNKLVRDKKLPLEKIDAKDIDQALRKVENNIRQKLQDRNLPKDVWDELETGGKKLSQVAPQADEQVGYA